MAVLLSDILSESSHLKAVNTTIIIETDGINDTIFSIILQIRKKHNRVDADSIQKQIIKSVDFENITKEFLDDIIHTLIILSKWKRHWDRIRIIIPDKSFYTPTISIPISSTEQPLISPDETP